MAYTDNFVTTLLPLVDDLVSADKMELSELLYSKSFDDGDISESHTITPGVRHGSVIPILNNTPNYDSFPFVDETSCVPNDCDITNDFASHQWELGLIECRVGICLRSFDESFLRFFNQWRHTQEGEPDLNTAMIAFMTDAFSRDHKAAMWRTSWFADKNSASPLFSKFDGFFTQAEANASQVIDIAKNDALTFAEQKMTGQEVYDTLEAMYLEAGTQSWFDPSILEFRVTRAMATALVTFLNGLNDLKGYNCECIDPNTATQSRVFMLNGLRIFGIPIMVHNAWDGVINGTTELNGGGGTAARVNPNRATLTYRNNLLIGTSQIEALESMDVWYSKDDKKVYVEGSSYLGAGIPMKDEYILAI
jgi:hypothetical protein